jgi:16S rRNA A1518/A1519 N6-dimethyltransferase RsmA/KsgA/DIM1 with predicted DNA glycosylase/AP lyase activity
VRKAFSQRRKVVRNALRPLYEPADVAAGLAAVGLSEDARAQDLTLEQFGALAWALQRSSQQGIEQPDRPQEGV